MENELADLRRAVEELANEEGISFSDARDIAVKALRFEIQRRKSFAREASCGGCRSTS